MKKWNRFENALAISAGACNPSGIAYSLIEACQEVRNECGDVCDDPAIRLMVSQLAYITGIWDGISDWAAREQHAANFHVDTQACRAAIAQNDSVEALSI